MILKTLVTAEEKEVLEKFDTVMRNLKERLARKRLTPIPHDLKGTDVKEAHLYMGSVQDLEGFRHDQFRVHMYMADDTTRDVPLEELEVMYG